MSNCLDDINLDMAQEKIEKHLKSLQPIKLPSDEEIGQVFKKYCENWEVRQALEQGAKWMRDKIKGGNNEIR